MTKEFTIEVIDGDYKINDKWIDDYYEIGKAIHWALSLKNGIYKITVERIGDNVPDDNIDEE